MKKLITIASGVLLLNLSVLAQGTISFQNVGPGFSAQIKDAAGSFIGPGAAVTVELLAGTTASVAPFATPVTTSTWSGNGWFNVGQAPVVLNSFAGGSHPFFQVRVWDNSGGVNSYAAALAAGKATGISAVWQLVDGGGLSGLGNPSAVPPTTAPPLFGMTGFQMVPEPSTIALGLLGVAAFLFRRRK